MNTPNSHRIPLLDLDLLTSLIAINDTGNFSAAADRIGRTPSAVSMQAKRLEELIGLTVFNRGTRTVTLTPVGEKLLIHARKILAENQQLMAELAQPEMLGEVHFGVLDDVAERYLPRILQSFHQHWPGIRIHVLIDNTHSLFEKVQKNILDVAIISSTSSVVDGRAVEELASERIVWAGLATGCAGNKRPLPITVWDDTCCFNKMAVKALNQANIEYVKAVVSYATSGQKLAVMADYALAPLSESSLDDKIVDVTARYDLPPIGEYGIGLIQSDKPLTPPVNTLVQYLRNTIK